MDYHDSSAGSARLAVAKYAATNPEKLGSIFFNPGTLVGPLLVVFLSIPTSTGGPGGSGIEAVVELGPSFSLASHGHIDFISWDPRGVGYTTLVSVFEFSSMCLLIVATSPGPVFCFDNAEEDAVFWENTVAAYINESIAGKFDQQDYDELYSQTDMTEQKFKTFTAGCQNGPSGKYLKYLGTSSVVRDLVSLGDAIVGQDKLIDYWGVSYGTVVGFNFINSEFFGLSIVTAH